MGRRTTFTPMMDDLIRGYWDIYAINEIARMVGRSFEAVRIRGRHLKLKAKGNGYTPEIDNFIRANWEKHTVAEIARMIGKGEDSVRVRGQKLGLKSRAELRLKCAPPGPRVVMAVPPLVPKGPVHTPHGWSDGWSIAQPTKEQLRAGR